MSLQGYLKSVGAIWYERSRDGGIRYTVTGLQTYRNLFQSIGIDIDAISTLEDHQKAMERVMEARKKK